jgi:UDP-glucuronate decarboxylase
MHPNDGRVVSNFIVQALMNRPITLYGDGSQTRSFCYADDLVDGLIRLMECDAAAALPVNLGNPEEYTVRALAEEVLAIAGGGGAPTHRPLPQDDPRQRRPDITRARSLLHWTPTIGLREGLERTVAYFRRHANRWGRGVLSAA